MRRLGAVQTHSALPSNGASRCLVSFEGRSVECGPCRSRGAVMHATSNEPSGWFEALRVLVEFRKRATQHKPSLDRSDCLHTLAASSPESEAHCLVHQTSHLVDDWGLRRPIPGTPHVPRDGAILSAALSSDGGRHTFLVCLVAFAGRLDQIRGLILAGPERCTQQLRDTRVP
jgi:hypothetical protein